jgi:hypothetical protein
MISKNEFGKGEILRRLPELIQAKEELEQKISEAEVRYRSLAARNQPHIDELQGRANNLAIEFKRLYREASDAYTESDGALAKQLSAEGHRVQLKCEGLNAQANTLRIELRTLRDLIYVSRQRSKEATLEIAASRTQLRNSRATAVRGFEASGLLGNLRIECILDSFPQPVFEHVVSIEYQREIFAITPSGMKIPALGETAWTAQDTAIIKIAHQTGTVPDEVSVPYSSAIAHEIGHVVYEKLISDHERAEWFVISEEAPSYLSTFGIEDEVEDFAEAFRLFILQPIVLEQKDQRKYRYIKAIDSRSRSTT